MHMVKVVVDGRLSNLLNLLGSYPFFEWILHDSLYSGGVAQHPQWESVFEVFLHLSVLV
jgi:hypothetical protein